MIKVSATGTVKQIDKSRKGRDLFFNVTIRSVDTGNPQPKGLPKPSDMDIVLMLNEKQYRKLQADLEVESLTVREGTFLVAEGRPYQMESDNRLHIVTYLVESLELKKIARAREKYPYGEITIALEEIAVPSAFKQARPEKIRAAVDYFNENKRFDKPIEIKLNGEGQPELVDGFAKYLAATQLNHTHILCFQAGSAVDK